MADITDVHRLLSLNVLVFLLIPSIITHMLTLSNQHVFFVTDWTLPAPNLPILVIEFGGRDVLLQLSGRLSLTVGFFFSDIIPIVNY